MAGALLLFVVGLILLGTGLLALWRHHHSRWRACEGQVVSHDAVSVSTGTTGSPLWRPVVRYTYEVQGQHFFGDRYAYSRAEGLDGQVAVRGKLAQYYAPGTKIIVWHRIDRPNISMLHLHAARSRSQMWALVTSGVLVAGVGMLVLVMAA